MKTSDLIEKKFIGTHELRKNLTLLLDDLKKTNGEVIITQQGKPKAILMSMSVYLELQDTLEDLAHPDFIEDLNKAVEEVEQGNGIPAEEVYKKLGIWMYQILYSNKAIKSLVKIPKNYQKLIKEKLNSLAQEPLSLDVINLTGVSKADKRLRVGSYRIFFKIDENTKQIIIAEIKRRTTTTYHH